MDFYFPNMNQMQQAKRDGLAWHMPDRGSKGHLHWFGAYTRPDGIPVHVERCTYMLDGLRCPYKRKGWYQPRNYIITKTFHPVPKRLKADGPDYFNRDEVCALCNKEK